MSYDLSTGQSKVEDCKLEIARENHTSQVVLMKEEHFIIVNGGWNGKESISKFEIFTTRIIYDK